MSRAGAHIVGVKRASWNISIRSKGEHQYRDIASLMRAERRSLMFIDFQTLIIIILATLLIGLLLGVSLTRPRGYR